MVITRITISRFWGCVFLCLLGLSGCSNDTPPRLTIAVNSWPGYSFLYLAERQGYFSRQGLDIKIVSVDSLSDGKRAFIHGRVDGMASTMVESVYAHFVTGEQLSIVLVTGYSNRGDVILARPEIGSISELKGKRVGCEVGSLGEYLLHKALLKNGLTPLDVEVVHTERLEAIRGFEQGALDAYVSYPPDSMALQKDLGLQAIFNSTEISSEILDTVVIKKEYVESDPGLLQKFSKAWQEAILYYKTHPEESTQFLAGRLGISESELVDILSGLISVDSEEAQTIAREQVDVSVNNVCEVLVHTGAINSDCLNIDLSYQL